MKSEFQDLLEANHKIVAKVCRIYTDKPEDFEDCYQECIVQLWRSFKTFRGASKFSTWVYRVCLNVCLTQLRTRKQMITTTQEYLPDIKIETDYVLEERMEILYKAIKLLKESDKAVILLYLEDKSYKDMADILGITVTNVGAKVNRVKNQLKSIINGRKRYQRALEKR